MKGSVLILVLFIMAAMSMLLVTVFSIAESHHIITINNNRHQEAYYLAESGIEFAQSELNHMVMEAYEDCLNEFQWDPLRQPMCSLQESVAKHMVNTLSPKINKKLLDMGWTIDFPDPILPDLQPDSRVDLQIRFTDVYRNPSRLLITSRSSIGKIRRRIDAEININKISNVYDSFLFDKALFTGNNLNISNGGNLHSVGSIHVQEGLNTMNNSKLHIDGQAAIGKDINIRNGCQVVFNEDVTCYGLYVEGENPSLITCAGDVYCFGVLSAYGLGNLIQVNGKLYINPDEESTSAGVSAAKGGKIRLSDEVFINGTLQYQAEAQYLFGTEYIPILDDSYHSNESIGGGNHSFYFPDVIPEYAHEIFSSDFIDLSRLEQGNLVYTYVTSPPESEIQLNQYLRHLEGVDCNSIQSASDNPLSGYTRGLVFANNQVVEPLQMEEAEAFFENLLIKMKQKSAWDFHHHLNPGLSVPLYNVLTEDHCLTVLNPEQPVVCIVPEEKDLVLPSGEYKGIIMTNGSIKIPPDEDVVFSGLLIAGKDLYVAGSLTLQEDRSLVLNLLGQQDDSLSRFFRIEKEKPLFEVMSCREVLYNAQW